MNLIPLWAKVLIVLALVGLIYGAGRYQGYAKEHDKFIAFQAQVKTLGDVAEKAAKAKTAAAKLIKEQSDHENKLSITALRADIKRLRDTRAGSGYLPTPPTNSRSPDLACFDRGELESAIRNFDTEIQGLVDQGSEATINLNTAKQWAESLKEVK